jgi:hypothetical protein
MCHPRREVFIRRSSLAGLEAHTSDNLAVSGARLILQEEVALENRKIRRNAKKCFIEMDEDGDLKNGVRVEMD